MKGFEEAIKAAIPDAKFVTGDDERPQHLLRAGQGL